MLPTAHPTFTQLNRRLATLADDLILARYENNRLAYRRLARRYATISRLARSEGPRPRRPSRGGVMLRVTLPPVATYLDAQRLAVAYGLDWGTNPITSSHYLAIGYSTPAARRRALARLIELGFTHAEEHDDV